MSSAELATGLHAYYVLLLHTERNANQGEFRKTASLSYATVALKLESKGSASDNAFPPVNLQCTFEVEKVNVVCTGVYCEDAGLKTQVKNYILDSPVLTGNPWNDSSVHAIFSAETLHYLAVADTIAKEAYLCSSGDDYRPGYYSEIAITDNGITLTQNNLYNSRSRDHKDNYFLRKLSFFIPVTAQTEIKRFYDYEIGRMLIDFSDHSSKNNKNCGDRLRDKIIQSLSTNR